MSGMDTDGKSPRFRTRAQNLAITKESAPRSSRRRTRPESPQTPQIRHAPALRKVRLSCFFSPRTGQKRTDHCLQPLLEREVSDQFADGKIKYPQTERAEHGDSLGTVPGGGPTPENVGQGTTDEIPVSHEKFRQVY